TPSRPARRRFFGPPRRLTAALPSSQRHVHPRLRLPPSMADSTPLPDERSIAAAERFTRERFVHDGEQPAEALAPGSARRRALDAALAELRAGARVPSVAWRREYALLLGLERLLSEDEPRLADGTLLNPHQVDALSGTLTAL